MITQTHTWSLWCHIMILNTQSMRWVFLPVEWVCHFHSLFPLDFKDNPESGNIKSVKQRRIPVHLVSGSTPSKESESCSIMTDSSRTENSSQKKKNNNNNNNNPGVGWHSFLQGIFPSQGSNPGLLHYRQFLYHLSQEGSIPRTIILCAHTKQFGEWMNAISVS